MDIITDNDRKLMRESIENVKRLTAIQEANIDLCIRLQRIVPDYGSQTILAIVEHKKLLNKFLRANCLHTTSVDKVVGVMKPDNILIYITELGLYGIFNLDNYLTFIKLIRDEEDEPTPIKYTPRQVIMSNLPQKIVFLCSGTEQVVDKIKRYSADHFKSDIDVVHDGDRTEVIVCNLITKDYSESREKFADFLKFVNKYESSDKLGIVSGNYYPVGSELGYVISLMDGHREIQSIGELIQKLNGGPITINIVYNQPGGNVYMGGNHNHNTTDPVIAWIKANPPTDMETTKSYYQRYCAVGISTPMSDNVFGRIAKSVYNYPIRKSNGIRYWVTPK